MSTSEMRRGMGGRIEESFAAAKESGKAAFVSFVTAGYPSPEGELYSIDHIGVPWFSSFGKIFSCGKGR